jgi:hypothetical protein
VEWRRLDAARRRRWHRNLGQEVLIKISLDQLLLTVSVKPDRHLRALDDDIVSAADQHTERRDLAETQQPVRPVINRRLQLSQVTPHPCLEVCTTPAVWIIRVEKSEKAMILPSQKHGGIADHVRPGF